MQIIRWGNVWHDRFVRSVSHLDGVASLMLRLILAPVLIAAGWEKITGENWFGYQLAAFPFPFNVLPADLSWHLAAWTEFLGGILLLVGLATRLVAIPLAVTMFVAAWAVHLDNGWPATANASMTKTYCTDICKEVCLDGLQVMGGAGYVQEANMQRYLREAVLNTIVGGTNEIQRNTIGIALELGLPRQVREK